MIDGKNLSVCEFYRYSLILKGGTLGRFVAYVWVVEFQKRELSHAHFCLILNNSDVSDTSAKSISWCRPELLEIIKNCIFHGQCSAK